MVKNMGTGKKDCYESLFIDDSNLFSKTFQTLNTFRETGELCDVVLRTEDGVETNAHRLVLSACSSYFRGMFTSDFLESRQTVIDIRAFDGYALRDIVDFFYTGKLIVSYRNVEAIICIANILDMKDLMQQCEVFLRRNMSAKNSLGLQAFAQQYSLTNLNAHALRFSCWHFNSVKDEEEFLLVPFQCLKELIENDSLKVPCEEYVFEAVVKWLSYDYEYRQRYVPELLKYIRFPLMNLHYLKENNYVNFLQTKFPDGGEFIGKAVQYKQGFQVDMDLSVFGKLCTPRSASEDIYVLGGWSNGQKISTVQCFNVDTLQWTPVSNMTVAHVAEKDYFCVTASCDELYTICYDKVMRYDPVDREWYKIAPGPEIQCKWAGVCEWQGDIYVIGGNSIRMSKRFSTDTCEWTELPLMSTTRYYPGVGVLRGKIYVIGGLDGQWAPLRDCEFFNPTTNTWGSIPRMKTARWCLGVAVLRNKLYAIGGNHRVEQFANSVEVYDPQNDSWERSTAPLNYGRRCLGVAVVNGYIYVVGGRSAGTIEYYNEDLNEWKVIGSVKACCNFGCVALRLI